MKRKGQFMSAMAVVVTALLTTGSFFTAIVGQQQVTKTVSYSTNHINKLLEAKVKKNIYRKNIKSELNYSTNNIAYRLANQKKYDWTENIPQKEEFNETLKNKIMNSEYSLRSQNRLFGCRAPFINQEDIEIISDTEFKLNLSGKTINCTAAASKVIMPIRDSYSVENTKNNFLEIAKSAIDIGRAFENLELNRGPGRGEVTTKCTQTNPSNRSSVINNALGKAKENARSKYSNIKNAPIARSNIEGYIEFTNKKQELIGESRQIRLETLEEDCSNQKANYTATYEYNITKINLEYSMKDSENKIATYEGKKHLKFKFNLSSRTQ